MSEQASRSEANLPTLTRVDRTVQKRRRDRQEPIDLEATEETGSASRVELVRRRRPDPTDDKINEAFRRATSC
jgi:hypothetical protein